jgi:translation initiation factor IF-1
MLSANIGPIAMSNNEKNTKIGVVVENLPNTMFRVQFDDQEELHLTYLAGKMKLYRIRILVGDKVEVLIDPYGGKGRIIKRL